MTVVKQTNVWRNFLRPPFRGTEGHEKGCSRCRKLSAQSWRIFQVRYVPSSWPETIGHDIARQTTRRDQLGPMSSPSISQAASSC